MDSFNCDYLIQPCHSVGLCFTRRLIMGNVEKTWSSLALDYPECIQKSRGNEPRLPCGRRS